MAAKAGVVAVIVRDGFIVRFLHSSSGASAGVGFVVGPRHVVTCAHVVNSALGRNLRDAGQPSAGDRIQIDFPMLGDAEGAPTRTCRVQSWVPPPADGAFAGDVAGLVVVGEGLPDGVRPARLVDTPDQAAGSVEVFGFPQEPHREQFGAWAACRLRGVVGGGYLQLDPMSDAALQPRPGYSGSPVLTRGRPADVVVGMLVVASGGRDSYAMPVSRLVDAWPEVLSALTLPPNPYRELQPFTAEDAARGVFVGRQGELARLWQMVRGEHSVFLVGASGVGKSSLAAAGLVPMLRAEGWAVASFHPGVAPFDALARAMLEVEEPAEPPRMRDLVDRVDQLRDKGLWPLIHRLTVLAGRPVALIVDQFEEVLSRDPGDLDRAEFLARVFEDVGQLDSSANVRLVCVLRADFLPQMLEVPGVGQHLQEGRLPLFPLLPLQLDALASVVREPAAIYGVSYEPNLPELIARDASHGRGGLPLLEFALHELWYRQRQRLIRFTDYYDLGGVPGALNRYAEQVFDELSRTVPATRIRRTLLSMIRTRGGSAEATRVAVRRDQFGADWDVVSALAAYRLAVADRAEASDMAGTGETAEIAHEALIREWDRLRTWVDEDAEFQHWLVQMEERAIDGDLLSEARIAVAERWLIERITDVPDAVRRLIAQSRTSIRQSMQELERARQLAEAAARKAEAAAREAEARRLAAAAELAISSHQPQPVFLALAIESLRTMPTLEGDMAIRRAVDMAPRLFATVVHSEPVTTVAFSPDGSLIVTGSWDNTIRVVDADTGVEICRDTLDGAVLAAAFSPDGRRVAASSDRGTLRVVEVSTGQRCLSLPGTAPMPAVAFSSDGSLLATAGADGAARVLDSRSGLEISRVGHDDEVNDIGFSPDATRIATASADGTARVLDAETGREICRAAHDDAVNMVRFSQDGSRIATASDDGTARVLDAMTGEEICRVTHDDVVHAAIFDPARSRLATASDDGTVLLVAADDGTQVSRFRFDDAVHTVAFNADGDRLVVGGAHRVASVIDVTTGDELTRTTHDNAVNMVTFSPDGSRVATASQDGRAHVLAVAGGAELSRTTHRGPVNAIVFSPDGSRIATASHDGALVVVETATGRERSRDDYEGPLHALAYSPDGDWLAAAGQDGTARIIADTAAGACRAFQHDGPIYAVAISRDSTLLATASADGTARVVDVTSGAELVRVSHSAPVRSVAFSPDGRRFATGSWDTTALVVEVTTGAELLAIRHDAPVRTVAFSPDGALVATASWDSTGRIVDLETRQTVARIHHDGTVNAVVFSPDGTRVATASDDGTARIIDVTAGGEVCRVIHDDEVNAVVFSPSGDRVATASDDGTARLSDARTGAELARASHHGSVRTVCFSPDGSQLATGGDDGTARLWTLDLNLLIEQAHERLSRDLTEVEWRRHFRDRPWQSVRTS
jgi:WD40 repeat protein